MKKVDYCENSDVAQRKACINFIGFCLSEKRLKLWEAKICSKHPKNTGLFNYSTNG